MHHEVVDREEKLSHLFKEAYTLQKIEDVDEELKVQFVWYLCVRTSGFVEFSLQTILSEYYESGTDHKPLGDFVSNHLLNPREFSMRHARGLIRSFKKRKSNLRGEFDFSRLDSSLETLQKNRNSIAHGRDSKLTMQDLDAYFEDARKVIRMVYDECYPPNEKGTYE